MTAFFSLGTPGSQNPLPDEDHRQQQQQYHQFYQNHNPNITNWTSLYRPVPTASPTRGFQLWHPFVEPTRRADPEAGFYSGDHRSGMSCQDCGNKAKKDCANLRCRSCCNSRGFDCPTHVKSTWVPAAKRRERHHRVEDLRRRQLEIEVEDEDKDRREKRSYNQTHLPNTNIKSGLEMVPNSLPPEVNFPAMFRCVKVTSTTKDDHEEQFAYQTSINVGGHLFKGILYDHGPDIRNNNTNVSVTGGSGGGGAMVDTNNNKSFIYPTINAFISRKQILFPSSSSFKS